MKTRKNRSKWIARFLVIVMLVTCLPVYQGREAKAGVKLYWPVPGHTSLRQGLHDKNAIDISDGSIGGATMIAALGGRVTSVYKCVEKHYGTLHNCDGIGASCIIKNIENPKKEG